MQKRKCSLHIYYLNLKQHIIREISQALTPMFCVYINYSIIAIIVECYSLHSVVLGGVTKHINQIQQVKLWSIIF